MRGFGLVLALVGCDEVLSGDKWVTNVIEDEGTVCLVTDDSGEPFFGELPGDQTFASDSTIRVVYSADTCLSSSCSRNAEASVTSAIEGSTIAITAGASVEENEGEGVACTDDCGALGAEGDVGTLADGTYTVEFGGKAVELTIPSTATVCITAP